jgi:hypothetical protein
MLRRLGESTGRKLRRIVAGLDRKACQRTRLQIVVGVGPAGLGEKGAINANGLTAYERRVFAEQEFDGGGDIVGSTDAAKGRQARPGSGEIGKLGFGALSVNRAGRDAIDANPEWAQLHRGGFGEHFDAAFAGGVAGKIREGNFVAAGADIHDGTGAVILHVPPGALGAEKAAL